MGDANVALGYLRVSTEDQRLGPEAQRAAITTWAERAGATVVAWFTDAGVSGSAWRSVLRSWRRYGPSASTEQEFLSLPSETASLATSRSLRLSAGR